MRGVLAVACCLALAMGTSCGSADPGYQGRTTKSWIEQLGRPDMDAREEAVDALGRVLAISPNQGEAVDALIRTLADTSDVLRVDAALALAKEGVHAEGAIPGLAAVSRDSAHPRVRRIAFETLGRLTHSLPPHHADSIAASIAHALAPGLDDPDPSVRMTALAALGGMRRAAAAAVPALAPRLVALTRDVDPAVRLAALAALAALPAPSSELTAHAVRMLADSAGRVRVGAVSVLQSLGPDAWSATPALVHVLLDRDPDVRRAAAVALGDVMPAHDAAATDALRRAQSDPDAAVRQEAAHSLTRFHQRGGLDPRPPEPTRFELCRSKPPGTPGC